MIVAGETSGDAHAAKLVNALRELSPEVNFEFFGAVSHHLREVGVESIVNADDFFNRRFAGNRPRFADVLESVSDVKKRSD